MLTFSVRRPGSQIVAVGLPATCVEFAAPTGHRLNLRSQYGLPLKEPHGIGPREKPSQVLHPMAQPFENPAQAGGQAGVRKSARGLASC